MLGDLQPEAGVSSETEGNIWGWALDGYLLDMAHLGRAHVPVRAPRVPAGDR